MNCSICGRASAPHAKLCDDCRSARKRAFAATVTQPLLEAAGSRRSRASARLLKPGQSMSASARRASRKAKTEPASVEVMPMPVPRPRWLPIAVALAVVILAAIGYVVYKTRLAGTSVDSGAEPPAQSRAPVAPPAPAPPMEVTSPLPAPASTTEASPVPPAEPAKKSPVRPKPAPPPVVVAPPAPEPPPPVVVAAPPPPPPVEVKPAPRVDPFQALNDAIAACSHEDVPTRLRCEQRARVRYCQGNWGVAFQCPLGPNPDAQ
jgi:hypothetical protein